MNTIVNKVIVITGGAGVIGESFVRSISENDGIAIIADIDFSAAQLLAAKVGGRSEAFILDITDKNL